VIGRSGDLKNRVTGSSGNRVIGTKIRLTTEEKSSRENKKFNISNTEKKLANIQTDNKSLFKEGQKQKLATKDTEENRGHRERFGGKKVKNSSQAAKNLRNSNTKGTKDHKRIRASQEC